jgi:aminoglycoside 3-N-acetyltransferase
MNVTPLTRNDILKGLKAIGVRRGMRIMVHSSLSSFGKVEGGSKTVIRALMAAVGTKGTIMMPSFNHATIFDSRGRGIYDPRTTPTTNGTIPDAFWRMPGVRRSLNPTHPFSCWGRDAGRYTARHHETLEMGKDSPLGLLAHDGGRQLNLGTTHETTTAKHVAETMRRVPCLGYRTESYAVRVPGGRIRMLRSWSWREKECPLTESGKLIEDEMERAGTQVKGRIGGCAVTFMKIADILDAVWKLLGHGHGRRPPCSQCSIRPHRTVRSVQSDV